jgi:hypothetical protein
MWSITLKNQILTYNPYTPCKGAYSTYPQGDLSLSLAFACFFGG